MRILCSNVFKKNCQILGSGWDTECDNDVKKHAYSQQKSLLISVAVMKCIDVSFD